MARRLHRTSAGAARTFGEAAPRGGFGVWWLCLLDTQHARYPAENMRGRPPAVGQPPSAVKVYNSCMAVIVSLLDLVDELQMLSSDESHVYLNKVTGKVISVTSDDFAIVENVDESEFVITAKTVNIVSGGMKNFFHSRIAH